VTKQEFYSVYNKLFQTLDHEEEQEEEVGTKHVYAPLFGDASTSKEQVYAFYQFWDYFATSKQFTFADLYDPRQAPNRRI